ncbi:OmpA family protein [Actinomadura macra]|uniref:OmpA family protein n=1 Tax=Actinomadura macra TaxID=46164 RepID=UPI000832FF65|nr:OmpA family protein [Actinomadura macra]
MRAAASVPLAICLTGLLLAAGCSNAGKAEKSDPPTAKAGGPAPAPTSSGGKYVREGWFGSTATGTTGVPPGGSPSSSSGGSPSSASGTSSGPGAANGAPATGGTSALHARVEVRGVERQGTKSVVRYSVTSLDSSAKSVPIPASVLDPVGRRYYRPTASTTGEQFAPGATREMVAEIPPLPQDVQQVTVFTPGTTGEFTGIPVTGTGGAPTSSAPGGTSTSPTPGSASSSPFASASPSAGGVAGAPAELYDITEGEIKDVTSSGSDVTVNLRTDVLFAFNSAKLSARAKAVLDEAAQEIKEKADPTRRPLTFNGHTDSKGSDSYNLKLSRDRAEAVMKELKNRLGGSYKYSAFGKGEADLIAQEGGADDAKARARNRRVEISYEIRQQTATTTGPSTAPAGGRGGSTAPSAFRPQDGATVASRYGRFGADKRRLDVKPFFRDGAYIVAVFDIVNEGPGPTPPSASYAHKDYPGGIFTSFSILAPNEKDVYRAVRIGTPVFKGSAMYVGSTSTTYRTGVNEPVRGIVYMPAPPGNITSVVFDGGPFGKVNNVPVS